MQVQVLESQSRLRCSGQQEHFQASSTIHRHIWFSLLQREPCTLLQVSATTLGMVPVKMLMAISCGAVFMGANTYIGNAPNFMVKSLSDENGINMPSFFGYIWWSLRYLIPVFIIDMIIFFYRRDELWNFMTRKLKPCHRNL